MRSMLYGIHDFSTDWAAIIRDAGKSAWTVISEGIGDDPADKSGNDYSALAAYNVTPIVRLNYSHHGDGTLPLPNRYNMFAQRCANFVSASSGCQQWIISNEPNLKGERFADVPITPQQYADAFAKCRHAIKQRDTQHKVIVAAVAPYNVDTGPWINYWREMLEAIEVEGGADGLALHFYSRGADPASITSDAKMDAPFGHLHNGFRAYRDFLAVVPASMRQLPAYGTETDQLEPWANVNSGWVQNAYAEIAQWNAEPSHQAIHCLCLYRWENFDQWGIKGKDGVVSDFAAAVGYGFSSPVGDSMNETFIPSILNESTSAPALPPLPKRDWDERLTQRGIVLTEHKPQPGETYMRIVKGEYWEEKEHTFAETLGKDGKRQPGHTLRFWWGNGNHDQEQRKVTELKPNDRWMVDFPMFSAGRSYGLEALGYASDSVFGMGLGSVEKPDWNIHVSYKFVFQLVTAPKTTDATPTPAPTGPIAIVVAPDGANIRRGPGLDYPVLGAEPHGAALPIIGRNGNWWQIDLPHVTGWVSKSIVDIQNYDTIDTVPIVDVESIQTPAPSVPQPTDNWARCIAYVRRWEGGWADDPNDSGGATNKGITIGTYTRWREAHGQPAPTKAELRNLTDAEANQIFFEWYWLASGADKMAWPLCLAHFDTAVNAGTGRAQEMLSKSGGVFIAYMGHLISWCTRIDGFEHFGRAWIRRRAEILLEAAK